MHQSLCHLFHFKCMQSCRAYNHLKSFSVTGYFWYFGMYSVNKSIVALFQQAVCLVQNKKSALPEINDVCKIPILLTLISYPQKCTEKAKTQCQLLLSVLVASPLQTCVVIFISRTIWVSNNLLSLVFALLDDNTYTLPLIPINCNT